MSSFGFLKIPNEAVVYLARCQLVLFCQYSDLVVMVRVALQLDSATALTAISIAARPQASLLYERFAVRPRLLPLLDDCFFIKFPF